MSLGYHVFARVKGSTKREMIAKFSGVADAYQYALNKSADRFLPENTSVTVTGWDGRQWFKFTGGELTKTS